MDIKAIISNSGLDFKQVASLLFPENKHQLPALRRVVAGKGKLDSEQLATLAALCGTGIDELMERKAFTRGNFFILSQGDTHITLNRLTGVAHVVRPGKTGTIQNALALTVSELWTAATNI